MDSWYFWVVALIIACVVGGVRRWFRLHAEAYIRGVLKRRYGSGNGEH